MSPRVYTQRLYVTLSVCCQTVCTCALVDPAGKRSAWTLEKIAPENRVAVRRAKRPVCFVRSDSRARRARASTSGQHAAHDVEEGRVQVQARARLALQRQPQRRARGRGPVRMCDDAGADDAGARAQTAAGAGHLVAIKWWTVRPRAPRSQV